MAELDWTDMPIHQAIKADWKTPELLVEGSLNCAKTTVFLDKELDALLKWPGIKTLLFRWSQDAVDTKLKPAFEELCGIRGIAATWDAKQKCFSIPSETSDNVSTCYMFGLKTVSAIERYNKIRGLGVSRIGGDQVEEMEQEVAGELRGRLRPDLTATLQGRRFPFQLTFVANPEDVDFWLSKEFPVSNAIKGRKLYTLSIFDNKHLPQESIDSLLRQYPQEHPKNLTMIQGKRGPNITGVPVYEGLYKRELHQRPAQIRDGAPILEAFEFGKHNPYWVFAQQRYAGGLMLLGGIRATGMALEDFLIVVKQYRKAWFPSLSDVSTCTSPMGAISSLLGASYTALDVLREAGFTPVFDPKSNAPDVRLGIIESISGSLRRRTSTGEESVVVNSDPSRWLSATAEGTEPEQSDFLRIAFEAGYSWDKHFVSVANKEVRQPQEDDKFANAMHCVENIVLNFCVGKPTDAEREEREQKRLRDDAAQRSAYASNSPHSWLGY